MNPGLSTVFAVWCFVLSATAAQSAQIDLIETVHYSFTFERMDGAIAIKPTYETIEHEGQEYSELDGFKAIGVPSSGSYTTHLRIGFWHHGSAMLDLAGKSFNLGGLMSSPPDYLEEPYYDWPGEGLDWLAAPAGHITFGPGNVITDWRFITYIPDIGEPKAHSSNELFVLTPLSEYWGLPIEDLEPFIGQAVYGYNSNEFYGATYWTNPGRWSSQVQRICYAGDGISKVPCPPRPPLNGCGPSGGVPQKCDDVALVPLPPSLPLLAAGVIAIGLLRNHVRRAVKDGLSAPSA